MEKLKSLEKLLGHHEQASQGIQELKYLLDLVSEANVDIDFTLARGLNYYTGCIFEAKAPEQVKMGSIGGGGRYDDLTGLFGVAGIPGIGISFGVDRIFDVMEELRLFPENLQVPMAALFLNMGEVESTFAYSYIQMLRKNGIACELYPDQIKMDKQFKYADKKNIQFAIIIGSKEIAEKECVIKNLKTGIQEKVALEKLSSYFQ
jgi:histidyl-tRNA synthetase